MPARLPNYALERSVTRWLWRAAGARTIIAPAARWPRLRRAGRASRGPLNADVRPHE